MTNPYLLPLIDEVLVGPNISRCSNSNGLEVETMFLLEKDVLICFLFWHDLQRRSSLYDILGRPLTKLCFCNFEINLRLAWPSFLYHTRWFFFNSQHARYILICNLTNLYPIQISFSFSRKEHGFILFFYDALIFVEGNIISVVT